AVTRNFSAAVPVAGSSGSGTCGTIACTTSQVLFTGPRNTSTITLETYGSPAAATGTITQSTQYCPTSGSTITIGGTTYTWTETAGPAVNTIYQSCYSGPYIAADLQAAINGNPAQCADTNCINTAQPANTSAVASGASGGTANTSHVVTVTALVGGAGGNTITFDGTGSNEATFAPTTGVLAGGANGTAGNLTGFALNTNPENLTGGAPGVTNGAGSPPTFATDGVLADDANNLATAIGQANAVQNVGVAAISSGAAVNVTANPRGAVGNSIYVGSSGLTGHFAWSGTTTTGCTAGQNCLQGGANGTLSATTYPIDGVAADNATQFANSVNFGANLTNLGLATTTATGNVAKVCAAEPGSTGSLVAVSNTATATSTLTFTANPSSNLCNTHGDPGIIVGDGAAGGDNYGNDFYFQAASGSVCGTGTHYCCTTTNYSTAVADGYSSVTAGNGTAGSCAFTYGFESVDVYYGYANYENLSPTSACNTGGAATGGTLGNFAWGNTTACTGGICLGGGSNGTQSATAGEPANFVVWSGAAPATGTAIATSFYQVALLNETTIGATPTNPSAGVVTFTSNICGPSGDYVIGPNTLSDVTWGGSAVSCGTNYCMTGGKCAIIWTDKGVGNGQTALKLANGGTSGVIGDTVANTAWTASQSYRLGYYITDSNGDIEQVLAPGISGSTAPNWSTAFGGVTKDNGGAGPLEWINLGPAVNLYLGSGTNGYKYSAPGLQ
ncbi:MAG: hypothetical protein ABSD20_21490, partial [Terriglobales bacterium]